MLRRERGGGEAPVAEAALKAEDLAVWAASLAQALEEAPRLGADRDAPEGVRWIILSDLVAREVSLRLRQAACLLAR
ncbi:MAG: hypothetical protein HXY24_10845 [Rubrivivax sp.]|nr:hypothetical protein [Rubrivivax sp.]